MWVRIDDRFPGHPKVLRAGQTLGRDGTARAISLFLSSLCYSGLHLTDGVITTAALGTMRQQVWNPLKVAAALAEAGLFDVIPEGYRIHDYHDYNPTSEVVKEKRARDSARKRNGFQEESTGNPKRIRDARAPAGAGDGSSNGFNDYEVQGSSEGGEPKPHPIRDLLTEYCQLFETKQHVKADIDRGKDTAILQKLIASHGVDRVQENLRTMFETSDEFICRSGYTIGILKACFNKLSVLSRQPNGPAIGKHTQGMALARAAFTGKRP